MHKLFNTKQHIEIDVHQNKNSKEYSFYEMSKLSDIEEKKEKL